MLLPLSFEGFIVLSGVPPLIALWYRGSSIWTLGVCNRRAVLVDLQYLISNLPVRDDRSDRGGLRS